MWIAFYPMGVQLDVMLVSSFLTRARALQFVSASFSSAIARGPCYYYDFGATSHAIAFFA